MLETHGKYVHPVNGTTGLQTIGMKVISVAWNELSSARVKKDPVDAVPSVVYQISWYLISFNETYIIFSNKNSTNMQYKYFV